jgi:hypothetical protein
MTGGARVATAGGSIDAHDWTGTEVIGGVRVVKCALEALH